MRFHDILALPIPSLVSGELKSLDLRAIFLAARSLLVSTPHGLHPTKDRTYCDSLSFLEISRFAGQCLVEELRLLWEIHCFDVPRDAIPKSIELTGTRLAHARRTGESRVQEVCPAYAPRFPAQTCRRVFLASLVGV